MIKYSLFKNRETGERTARINKTGEIVSEATDPVKYKKIRKKVDASFNRRAAIDESMESLGLFKVKGVVSGKTYWE